MSIHIIPVDSLRMLFPTDVSPFIFSDSTELVQKMLKEANSETEKERKIIKEYVGYMFGVGDACCFIIASMTIVGLPFYCCYNMRKQTAYKNACETLIKKWEDISKRYNNKFVENGLFVRFITQSQSAMNGGNAFTNQSTYCYEFSFKEANNILNVNNNQIIASVNVDGNLNNLPPPILNKS